MVFHIIYNTLFSLDYLIKSLDLRGGGDVNSWNVLAISKNYAQGYAKKIKFQCWKPFKFIRTLSSLESFSSCRDKDVNALSKHGKPLTKQLKQISLWQKANYTRNWEDFACMIICLHTQGSYISVFVWATISLFTHYICFWGRNGRIWSNPSSPSTTPFVSALLGSLMTAEWSPHYWEELACNFTSHFLSMLSNNKWQPALCTAHSYRITWTRGDKLSQE